MIGRAALVKPYFQARLHHYVDNYRYDYWLLGAIIALLAIGLVMMGSASSAIAEKQFGQPFYYIWKQTFFIGVALVLSWGVLHVPI